MRRKPKITSGLSDLPTNASVLPESEPKDTASSATATSDMPVTPVFEPVGEDNTQEVMDITPLTQELPVAVNMASLHPVQEVSRGQDEMVQDTQETTDGARVRRDDEEDEGIVEDMDEESIQGEMKDQNTVTPQPPGNAVEIDAIADELSSEMSQMGLSERGVDHFSDQPAGAESGAPFIGQEEDEAVVMKETPSKLLEGDMVAAPTSLQKVLRHEFRLPRSDRGELLDSNITSQPETDTTQPDDRFLDCSTSATASVDDGLSTPVRLHFDTSSTLASPNAPRTINRAHFSPEALHESDREGSDDAVTLVKSPSAGRGLFGRNQGVGLRSGLFAPNRFAGDLSSFSPSKDITSGLYKGALKRKLENVLAEERAADRAQSLVEAAVETPGTQRLSGLLAHKRVLSDIGTPPQQLFNSSLASSMPQQSEPWANHSPSHPPTLPSSPMSPMQQNEPLELLFQTTPPPASQPHQAAVDRSHQKHAQLASGYFHPSLSTQLECGSTQSSHAESHHDDYFTGPQQTPPPLQSQRRLQHVGTPIVPFQDYLMRGNVSEMGTKPRHPEHAVMCRREPEAPVSQSSPIAFSSPEGSHSPVDAINFMGQGFGFSSPTQSPSRRAQRTYFPVMTHAEQEKERVYQHYHGNQLPEPAGGQKKMRSSSSLAEAYEEYGEGAMVFIE